MNTARDVIRWSPDPHGSHVSTSSTALIVRFVRARCGDEGVARLLELGGGGFSATELCDASGWVSYDRAVSLFEAAVEVSGDPSAGWAIGEETLRQHTGTPVEALLRSLGSPAGVLRNIAGVTSKFAAISTMEAVEIDEGWARVSARCLPGFVRHPIFCDYVGGQLSQIPLLFGLEQGVVVEEECQTRGEDRCLYYMRWGEAGSEARVRLLEGQVQDLSYQMEALQSIATSLVSADDIDSVLSSIATRAADAVRAQGYLLAVRAVEGGPMLVHHHGLGVKQVDALVPLLMGASSKPDTSQLMVDVRSSRRHYGRLLAVGPSGIGFFDAEKRLFASYAELAAAALDGATALEDARRRADTTSSLLDMARALANTEEVEQLCRRAAEVVPAVVGCDKGAVFLYDRAADRLTIRALAGFGSDPPAGLVEYAVGRQESPRLDSLIADPQILLYCVGDVDVDPAVPDAFELFGVQAYALVPVVVGGEFAGVVAAGWSEAHPDLFDDHLAGRMAGLADQVASSLITATLIEQTRHQALHDRLRGRADRRHWV
ncbi:MAG TPA: GAF domain-containing protein [Acidimicrobiales bacterium]|nr:GAF domain-containing protein [Acidimicrobiales bacterium]